MIKLTADYLLKPPFCGVQENADGSLQYVFPMMPEALKIQVQRTSKDYYKIILYANNRYYSLRIRYKKRVERFLYDVALRAENVVKIIDRYKKEAAVS